MVSLLKFQAFGSDESLHVLVMMVNAFVKAHPNGFLFNMNCISKSWLINGIVPFVCFPDKIWSQFILQMDETNAILRATLGPLML